MTNKSIFLPLISLLTLLLFCKLSTAQFVYIPTPSYDPNALTEFEYQDNFYDTTPRGLRYFLEDTTMDSDLKRELTIQAKRMNTNKTVGLVALYGGFAVGAGIMITEVTSGDGENPNTGKMLSGLGVFLAGGIINWIVKPKKNDYLKFFNTFNRSQSDSKINIGLNVDYSQQMNYGLVLSF